jgi:hypothetical protein
MQRYAIFRSVADLDEATLKQLLGNLPAWLKVSRAHTAPAQRSTCSLSSDQVPSRGSQTAAVSLGDIMLRGGQPPPETKALANMRD